MTRGLGMEAVHAADHIVLLVFTKQHAAVDAKTICSGADFHGQVTPAGDAFALYVQGAFTGVVLKEFF